MSAENLSWSAIQDAYADDYERTFMRIAKKDAPAVRFGEQWVDVLSADKIYEIDGLLEYMNKEERKAYTAIGDHAERLTDEERIFCEVEDAWNASLGLDDSIGRIEEAIAKARNDVTEVFEKGE